MSHTMLCYVLEFEGIVPGKTLEKPLKLMLKKVREPCFTHDDLISVFASGSRGSDEGTFDCDTVIQSVTILGVENKPSTVVVHASGEELRHYRYVCSQSDCGD